MNVKGWYCLSFDDVESQYNANFILERPLRATEGRISVNESTLTIRKQIWTQMNRYFL